MSQPRTLSSPTEAQPSPVRERVPFKRPGHTRGGETRIDWSKLTKVRAANEPDRLKGLAEELVYLKTVDVSEEELKDAACRAAPPDRATNSQYKGVFLADPRKGDAGSQRKGQGITNRSAAWSEGREWMAVADGKHLGFFFTERAAAVAVFMSTNGERNVDFRTYFDQSAAGGPRPPPRCP